MTFIGILKKLQSSVFIVSVDKDDVTSPMAHQHNLNVLMWLPKIPV